VVAVRTALAALGIFVSLLVPALAQTQSVVPNGMTTFVDGNGAPYAGGHVYMYVPHTTTPKVTYQDPNGNTPNSNPINLDANGRAIIWGNGEYRQVLQDLNGVVVWDQLTYTAPAGTNGNTATFWYGTASGTANAITLSGTSGFNRTDGQVVGFLANATNTGAVTVNTPGQPNVILEKNSISGPVALTGGEVVQNDLYYATYSSGGNVFILQNYIPPTSSVAGGTVIPGVVCDAVTDNTTAINNAIAGATDGAWFILPIGQCNVSGTIVIGLNGIHLSGQGLAYSTFLNFTGSGATDGFQIGTFASPSICTGGSAPSGCGQIYGVQVDNMSIGTDSRTGGYMFHIDGASQVTLRDIYYHGYAFLETQYVNNLLIESMNGYAYNSIGASMMLYQTITSGTTAGWYRTDLITFDNFNLNNIHNGGNCLVWDGPVFTVRVNQTALLECNYGIQVNNSQASSSEYPEFLFANDLEVDSACSGGIAINAGSDFHISNSFFGTQYCNGSTGKFPLLINPDTGVSVTHGVSIVNSQFHDSGAQAAVIGGKDVYIANSSFFDTNHAGSGATPAIEIIAGAQNVIITNSLAGQRYGDPDAPNYGVIVDAGVGAGPVSLSNMDYAGATTGDVDNLASSPVGNIGGIRYNSGLNTQTQVGAIPAVTTGSCSASSPAGGLFSGTFVAPTCAAGTIILSGMTLAPHGWACTAADRTTPANTLQQTSASANSATFLATTTASDVVSWACSPY